jgi:hypothetical protein
MRPEDQDVAPETVERRVALRRGAAVLAGVAGLTAAAAATGSAAEAAPGDPVVQGQANNAAASTTSLSSTSGSGTLQVANTGTGAPLRVARTDNFAANDSIVGDVYSVDLFGDGTAIPTYTHVTGSAQAGPALAGFVYTDAWSLQPAPITPTRQLDTRTAAGRAAIVNAAGNLDSSGRLLGGHTITLSLSDLVFGFAAVYANVTVTGTTGAGFVSVYPFDPRPAASTINFATNQTLSNGLFVASDFDGQDVTLRIFALVTTHVILDVTGFAVPNPIFQVNAAALAPAARSLAGRPTIDMSKAPQWVRRQQAQHGR